MHDVGSKRRAPFSYSNFFLFPPSLHRISSNRTMYFFLFVNPKPWYPQKNQRFKFYRWKIVVNCQRIWGRTLFTLSNNLMKSSNRKVRIRRAWVLIRSSRFLSKPFEKSGEKSQVSETRRNQWTAKRIRNQACHFTCLSLCSYKWFRFVQTLRYDSWCLLVRLMFDTIWMTRRISILTDWSFLNRRNERESAQQSLLLLLFHDWHNLQCGFVLYVFMCAAK